MRRGPRWRYIAALALISANAGAVTVVLRDKPPEPGGTSAVNYDAASKQQEEDALTVIAVIGDSFTAGSDMNAGPAWPELARVEQGWLLENASIGGTGYINPGVGDRPEPFIRRVQTANLATWAVDLIIVAGGRNDLYRPAAEVAAAAGRMLDQLRRLFPSTDIAVLSPWSSGNPGPEVNALTAALRPIAGRYDAEFIDVSRMFAGENAGLIGRDGVHPTDEGHRLIARRLPRILARHGLPRPDAWREASS